MINPDQAKEYLGRVVPWSGDGSAWINLHWTVLNPAWTPASPKHIEPIYWNGTPVKSVDEAIGQLGYITTRGNARDIYVCMSSQRDADTRTANGREFKVALRKQRNAVALKSLFIDLDAKGEDKNSYANIGDAIQALAKFVADTGMPKPSLVVSSGGGLHLYWTLARALTPAEWTPLAYALAEATKRHGLKCDTQCTVDSVRVLRVPGTKNFKTKTPREVRLAGTRTRFDYPVEQIEKVLEPYNVVTPKGLSTAPDRDLTLFPLRTAIQGVSELAAGIEATKYEPIALDLVLPECGFLNEAVTSGGKDLANPLWNLTNLIAVFCEDGRAQAHRMGCQHPNYDQDEADAQFDRKVDEQKSKGLGWPSCGAISGAGSKHCQACPHFTKGKSPLHFAARALAPQCSASELLCTRGADPLDFVETTLDDAVDRINNEYFFRRDTSEICRQSASTGEIQVLTPQQFNTALAGRWVKAEDPKTGKTKMREAAAVWLESRARREVHGVQYRPNSVGLREGHLNLWLGWGVEPVLGDCSIVLDHIQHVMRA
jgi:hypothetical protein